MRQADELHFNGNNVLDMIIDTIRDTIIDQ